MVIALSLFLERMSGLLPAEKKQVLLNVLPQREPFEILYRLNCDNLFTDFHEDLSFKFTEVRRSIISRFVGKKANSLALTNYSQQVSMLCIVVSVTGTGLIELIL
jgi:mitofusin